jgi:hypothetical protein
VEEAKNSQNEPSQANAARIRLRERAIACLLSTASIVKAAKECGISRGTLQRWMHEDSEFQSEFLAAKASLLKLATTKLVSSSLEAAVTLKKVFRDRKSSPAARVMGATQNLKLALQAFEFEDLEARIRKLEEQSNDE